MTSFLTEDFLLHSDTAKDLYHGTAATLPIIDYHCHLPPEQVANNHQFKNLTDIWLSDDHYKWRAMRANGIPEAQCSGTASDKEKFMAWAKTVPTTLGNPLFHWTHLELRRPFGISDCILTPGTAERIWHQCNEMLTTSEFSTRGIMQQMNVRMVGTTDDPIDDLSAHYRVNSDETFNLDMLPSWRPDNAFAVNSANYVNYLSKLGECADVDIRTFDDLCLALSVRMEHFAAHGCQISDHGLDEVVFEISTKEELDRVLASRLCGLIVSDVEAAKIKTAVLIYLGKEYCRRGWTQQYHIGAYRDVNSRLVKEVGQSKGFDSISDKPFAQKLGKLLDTMERENCLPKTILYCLNPRDNEVLATMCGNFPGCEVQGKMQFGSGWWFNDQKDGMERQLEQLSQMGILSHFVGMVTDSRSFLSYTRHEYFRRILCNMIGRWVQDGEAPNDIPMLSGLVEDICFNNANRHFNLRLEKNT